MKPVRQTRYLDEHGRGNCMAASLASLLELSLEDVPKFETMKRGEWQDVFLNWLDSIGKDLETQSPECHPDDFCIAVGTSPRFQNSTHSVIYKNGELVFDPHPDAEGLAEIKFYWVVTDKKTEKTL